MNDSLTVGTASALNSAYWSASTFGDNQFAQASLPDSSGTSYGPGIAVRLSSTKGYFLWYGNSPNTVSLRKMSSSTSWTTLKQSGPLTISPSTDVWRIQVVGSTISGYQNGNLVVQATDTSITSGSPGVWSTIRRTRSPTGPAGTWPPIRSAAPSRGCPAPWCCRTTAGITSATPPSAGSPSRPPWPPAQPMTSQWTPARPGRPARWPADRHRRIRRHHQHRRHLHHGRHLHGRRHGLGAVRHRGAAGQRRG